MATSEPTYRAVLEVEVGADPNVATGSLAARTPACSLTSRPTQARCWQAGGLPYPRLVAEDQLSLAIGRRGQNVRLASKLVGWDIDIMTEEQESEQRDGDDD